MLHLAEEERLLLAKSEDLLARARAGEVTCTSYLTPREVLVLSERFADVPEEWEADGGYAAAERKRFFFLPEYVWEADATLRKELLSDMRSEHLTPVWMTGSGFRELSHRDFLGAVLNLGIRRNVIGDLCPISAYEAVLFADGVLCDFLCENLVRVANDRVRVQRRELPPSFDGGRRFASCSDTVPSARADAVVAAICNLSREKAQALFREGRVEIMYEPVEKTDRPLEEGEVLVLRGYGKFVVRSLSEQTKKGRFRLIYDRYI